jgi:hypothetical protein
VVPRRDEQRLAHAERNNVRTVDHYALPLPNRKQMTQAWLGIIIRPWLLFRMLYICRRRQVDEGATFSESLKTQAQKLVEAVAVFRLEQAARR